MTANPTNAGAETRVLSGVNRWLEERFELSRGAGHNVRSMEGLRGLAVFLVFFVHYGAQMAIYLPAHSTTTSIAHALQTAGAAGVDLFFVLSGYLIYGKIISRPQPFLTFIRRRIERIYPTFIAVFAIYVLFSFLHPADDKIPHSLPQGLAYLAANFFLLPGLFPITAMITQAWSLSYELFFYLAIPLLVTTLMMRRWAARARIAFFLAISILFVLYCSVEGGHVRLIMFVSGIVLYEVLRNRIWPAPPSFIGPIAFLAGLIVLVLPLSGAAGYSLQICALFVAFFLLCHVCFGEPAALATRVMSLPPIRWFGNMSYSYYLFHGLVLKALFLILPHIIPVADGSQALYWLMLPFVFVATVIPSTVLFVLVERPFSLSPALEKRAARETGGDEPALIADPEPVIQPTM